MFIQSIKHEKVLEARELQTVKGRLSLKKFLVEGEDQIKWLEKSHCELLYVFAHDKQQDHPFIQAIKNKGISVYFASDGIIKKITHTSYLVPFVGVASFPADLKESRELVVVLDGLQDLGNIGTMIRTSMAFGIDQFVFTQKESDVFYKKTIDASRGTAFLAHIQRFDSPKQAVLALKQQGYQIAVTTPHSSMIQSFADVKDQPIAIIFGNETHGVCQDILAEADLRIQIPMSPFVESLNVGVAAGISLYEMKIKWILAMLTKKIQTSIGRSLSCASQWMRLVFDAKLKESSPFSAEQAIIMMMLKCEGPSNQTALLRDARAMIEQPNDLIEPLIQSGYLSLQHDCLSLTEKGEEAIASIWSVHEWTEQKVFEGISQEDKAVFLKVIDKLMTNCEAIIPFS